MTRSALPRGGRPLWAAALALAVLLPGARAVGQDCERPNTIPEMQECAALRFRAAERELARVEDRLAAGEGDVFRQALREAQVAWRAWRDAEGRLAAAATEDPGLAVAVRKNTEAQMTEDRVKDLRGYSTDQ